MQKALGGIVLLICAVHASDSGIIKGFVKDASNGERLSYADVYIEGTGFGCSTDDKGYYYLSEIPAGHYQLTFAFIGYEAVKKEVSVASSEVLSINAELQPTVIAIAGVTTTAERERFEKAVEISHVTFTTREIKSVPMIFEADLIKSVQLMPGVVTMHDLSNKLYIRGGSPDENLVLLDGIIVYNPSTHLGGLFSTFNPDAVSEAELYAGGFPAQYGDRLSAVLDIETKEGNSKEYAGEASVGLITSRLLAEGPIPKGSFLFSGRRTYLDAIVWGYKHIFDKDVSLPYYFYDGVAKLNYNLSADNRFTLTGFGGSDVLAFEEVSLESERIGLKWGNRGASLRWRSVVTPRLYSVVMGVWSNFFTHLEYENENDSTQNLHLYEELVSYTGSTDYSFILDTRHRMDFGLHVENLNIAQHWEFDEGRFGPPSQLSNLVAFYVQDWWELVPPILFMQPGIRSIYYSTGNRFVIDPRLGLKYRYGVNSTFNLSVGKYSQFLVTINSQESYFSLFDFWRPVDSTHLPPYSLHFISGIEHWFGSDSKLTIEGYFKKYGDLLIPDASDIIFSVPAESLEKGSGYSTGMDFFYKKQVGAFFGWVSYSFGFTRREVNGVAYYPRYDRRHNLNIIAGIVIPEYIPVFKHGSFDLRWYLATGLPYAHDIARYSYYRYDLLPWTYDMDREWRYIKGPRDTSRLPVSHRLDCHYERKFKLFGLDAQWYLDVINVYAAKNIVFYTWEYPDYLAEEPPTRIANSMISVPVPSIGFSFKF